MNRFILHYGLTKLISNPTRYGVYKDSCIDQIITNSNHISDSGVGDLNISDHQLIYFLKKKKKEFITKVTFEGRSYRNYNLQLFTELLDNQKWDIYDQTEDPNILWDTMIDNITSSIDQICPIKTFKIKKI